MFKKMGSTLAKVKRLSRHIKAVVEQEFKQKSNGVATISSTKIQGVDTVEDNPGNKRGHIEGEFMSDHIIEKVKKHNVNPSRPTKQLVEQVTNNQNNETKINEQKINNTKNNADEKVSDKTISVEKRDGIKVGMQDIGEEIVAVEVVTKLKGNDIQVKTSKLKLNFSRKNEVPQITMNNFTYVEEPIIPSSIEIDEQKMVQTMKEIEQELSEALRQWKWTKQVFNYAIGSDQVEYCIYQMMAAEQRYRMTLVKARNMQVEWSKVKGDLV